ADRVSYPAQLTRVSGVLVPDDHVLAAAAGHPRSRVLGSSAAKLVILSTTPFGLRNFSKSGRTVWIGRRSNSSLSSTIRASCGDGMWPRWRRYTSRASISSSVAQAGLFDLVRPRAGVLIREMMAIHWGSVTGKGLPPPGIRRIAAPAKSGSAAS